MKASDRNSGHGAFDGENRVEKKGLETLWANPTHYEGTYLEFLGFQLADWKEGFARLEMPVRPEHRNTVGYLHGGVTASLLDISGAVAGSFGIADEFVSLTINLNCNYIAPHKSDVAIAEAELIRPTSSLFFSQAKLLDPDHNTLCATATGTYKTKPREAGE
jgi:uncharacterized protein (TIGR00369 family)